MNVLELTWKSIQIVLVACVNVASSQKSNIKEKEKVILKFI